MPGPAADGGATDLGPGATSPGAGADAPSHPLDLARRFLEAARAGRPEDDVRAALDLGGSPGPG